MTLRMRITARCCRIRLTSISRFFFIYIYTKLMLFSSFYPYICFFFYITILPYTSYHVLPQFFFPCLSHFQFVDGEWVLDEPLFVLATFLNDTALECQLPLEDSWVSAGVDLETVTNRPLARWQIKVSHVSRHFMKSTL